MFFNKYKEYQLLKQQPSETKSQQLPLLDSMNTTKTNDETLFLIYIKLNEKNRNL